MFVRSLSVKPLNPGGLTAPLPVDLTARGGGMTKWTRSLSMLGKSFFYNLLKISLSTVVVVFILATAATFAGFDVHLPFIARVDLSGYVTRSELFEKLAEYLKKGEYFISSCASGSSIRVINADGTVVCESDTDTNTTYTAGSGLFLFGTEFSVSGLTNAHIASGAAIGWSKISKTGSSLADLITRSASDLTIGTLADAQLSSNVSLLGQLIETGEIANDTVLEVDLALTNSPTGGYVLSYDSATGGFTWVQDQTGGGAGLWTDQTTYIEPNTIGANEFRIYDSGGLNIGGTSDPGSGNLNVSGTITATIGDSHDSKPGYFSDLSASGAANFQDVFVGWVLRLGSQTLIVGGPYTLTPTVSYQEIDCTVASCSITMGETDVEEGTLVLIVNVSANTVNFADTAGVSELVGDFAAGQWDSLTLIYAVYGEDSSWVEVSRSNN